MNVFPIKKGAKFPPLVQGWQQAARPRERWAMGAVDYPDCNWGVHCEGMVVVDVDPKNGGDESFVALEMIYGFPPTRTVQTPSGGSHLYYLLPPGHPGAANRPLAKGIDIKSTGGYVVAAGSKTEAGEYILSGPWPIEPAPEWLLTKVGTYVPKVSTPKAEIPDAPLLAVTLARDWLCTRPKGDEAYATACGLRDFGLSAHQALQALVQHDGRSLHILESKVRHAYEYAKGEPGGKVATLDDFEIVAPAPAPKAKHGARRFLALTQDAQTGASYLIKGMLQRASHAVLYGQPGAGKTFVALDIAYHVAASLPWFDKRVHGGLVLYLAYEGVGGISKRAQALRLVHGDADVPLYVQAADYNLRTSDGRKALAHTIAELPETPALIVIDTLARAMAGGDENSAKEMGELNDAVTGLIAATDACVLLVHHSGKNKSNGARGSSALLGAVDTEIEVDSHEIRATKQRDVELGNPIGFQLTPHMVGMDEDDEPVMSCTVEPRDLSSGHGPIWTAAYKLGILSKRISYPELRDVMLAKPGWNKQKFSRELRKEEDLAYDKKEIWYVGEEVDSS